jgi:hypothetical protein
MGFNPGGGGGGTATPAFAFGTAAARPAAAGNANTGYYATDTGEVTFSDGAAWNTIGQITPKTDFNFALAGQHGGSGPRITINSNLALQANAASLTQYGDGSQIGGSAGGLWALTGASLSVGTIGRGLAVAEGANGKQGVATLVAGTVVVANTSVTATSRIQLTCQSLGTVAVPSAYGVSARVPGTSFTILASVNTDTSVIAYEIFEVG